MDKHIRNLLDALPSRPYRSKLEPHRELICELRRKRHTYQEIAGFFGAHLSLAVAPSTIHNFLKVRSLLWHTPSPAPAPQATVAEAPTDVAQTNRSRRFRRPGTALVLRSVRVLLHFLRTVK